MKNYGRSSKLLLAAKDVPNLQFDVAESEERGESAVRTDVVEIIEMDTNESVMASQNSDVREHSKNSLESAAGGASDQVSEQRIVEKTMDLELTIEPANTENILKNCGIVKKRQLMKRQEKLYPECWTKACILETVKTENILETHRYNKSKWT